MPAGWEAWLIGQANWLAALNYHCFLMGGESLLPHANLMVDIGITRTRPFQKDN